MLNWKYCERTQSFWNFGSRIRKSAEIFKHSSRWPSENLKKILTFRGPCIVVYSYNRSQKDAWFLNFISMYTSVCFGKTYCPSSGILILYSQKLVFVYIIYVDGLLHIYIYIFQSCNNKALFILFFGILILVSATQHNNFYFSKWGSLISLSQKYT